ncbi:MAG: hypothetical protein ABIU29_05920 [Chthoniobacterales bacterium]
MNDEVMKKVNKKNDADMPAEYDFSHGVRGQYAHRYAQGSNVVVLEPDVARAFPNAEAVNSSLRALAQIISQAKACASEVGIRGAAPEVIEELIGQKRCSQNRSSWSGRA